MAHPPSSPAPTALDGRLKDIVAGAAELFDKRGYDRVSMEDIAEAVGLAKPSLYHYVKGKDEILTLIHSEFMELVFQQTYSRRDVDLSASDELIAMMADILGLMHTHRGYVRVFFEHHRELPRQARKTIGQQRDSYEERVRGIIVRGIEAGEFRDVNARLATLALFGMCNWAYQWYQAAGPLTPQQIAVHFSSFFLDGIARRPASQS